jgi:hypothetical protein
METIRLQSGQTFFEAAINLIRLYNVITAHPLQTTSVCIYYRHLIIDTITILTLTIKVLKKA